jgi:hypothetical protein
LKSVIDNISEITKRKDAPQQAADGVLGDAGFPMMM